MCLHYLSSVHPNLLLLTGLGGRLGDLTSGIDLVDLLDDTDGNSLSHVSDGESSERSVLAESLNADWLAWLELDDGGVTTLDLLWGVLNLLTRSSIDLLLELVESASDVGGVAIEHRGVTLLDLTWVVQDDDLSIKGSRLLGGVVLGVRAHVTSSDVLDGDVLDVEADVVAWHALWELLVVHLDGLDLSGYGGWGKGDNHTGLDGAGLDSADWHSSDTANLVDVLGW